MHNSNWRDSSTNIGLVEGNNCTAGWKQIGKMCYKVANTTTPDLALSMAEAAAVCRAEGGSLPSFHSIQEWSDFNVMR